MASVLKQDDNARQRILLAATRQFSAQGLAGARTDQIAADARVNVALIFYYFKGKEKLYAAVLEQIFSQWAEKVTAALARHSDPEGALIAYVEAHFDFVANSPLNPQLVQQEMMRQSGSGSLINGLADRYLKAVHADVQQVIKRGIAQGRFHPLDPVHLTYSLSALVFSYFCNRPMIEAISGDNPCSPRNVKKRREEVLQFVKYALLKTPAAGRAAAAPSKARSKKVRK